MPHDSRSIILYGITFTIVLTIVNYVRKRIRSKRNTNDASYLQCRTLSDFEDLAQKLMKPHRFYYYSYKAGHGQTYKASRKFFDEKLRIVPRALMNVTSVSLRTKIFGSIYDSPIIIAPTTFHCLANENGEVSTARGAAAAQCIYTYNWTYSTKPEDEVLQIEGHKLLHVYLTMPTEVLKRIVSTAEAKGYRAIVVTCDHPTERVRDHVLPLFEVASKTTDRELLKNMPMPNMNASDIVAKQNFSTGSVTWASIREIKLLTKLPVICKGILATIDAELAIEHGADGIVVSNHGGRQVDTAPPAIEFLEQIVDVVNGRAEVFVDSGIRSGTDILKSIALGAKGVFIGRPVLYGLACGGDEGVRRVLEILKQELIYDMSCCGVCSIDEVSKNILYDHH